MVLIERRKYKRYLSTVDVWSIAFGCMVGWGAFVMPGTTFLPLAGPAGAVIAMVVGTVLILAIGRNYGYLMTKRPGVGGIYSYVKEAFGRDHAFISSWFLSLSYLTIVFLNATALFLIARTLFGGLLQVGFHYQIAGNEVFLGEIILSVLVLVFVGLFFIVGKRLLQYLQTILAIVLGVGVLVLTMVIVPHMDVSLLGQFSPTSTTGPIGSILAMVLLVPWAFVGFDVASLETTHFKFPIKRSWRVMAISIFCAALAYGALIFTSISFIPDGYGSWVDYMKDLDNLSGLASVPTFYAARETMGRAGVILVTVCALAAIFTGVIGAARAMVRMLSTMAEDRILSTKFSGTTFCILFVMGVSILISFLGRNALIWFVELTSFGAVIGFGYVSAVAIKLARKEGNRFICFTGGVGVAFTLVLMVTLLLSSVGNLETMSSSSFLLLAFWCLLGFLFYWRTVRQGELSGLNDAPMSSTILFVLLVYCVLMWSTKTLLAVPGAGAVQGVVIRNTLVIGIFVLIGLGIMLYIQSLLRRRHKELERERIYAEEGSKAKSQFLFNMSHDIRTPVNAIVGFTYLAKQQEDVPPEVQGYIGKIEVAGKQLVALVDDILEMSRIETGNTELEPVETDLAAAFTEVSDLFTVQMAEKNVTYEVDCSQVREPWVFCDQKRFNRVLQNLLSNASKFTPSGGKVRVTLQQVEGAEEDRSSFELRVKDTGIGMSPEFVERLFDAFERERTSTVSGIQGTGLGMAITKAIVDMMQGTIEVETAPGEGTEFILHLTFDKALPGSEPHATAAGDVFGDMSGKSGQPEPASQAPTFDGLRALLVEDNEVNREILTAILVGYGLEVEYAEDGQEALDILASADSGFFDLVLMDIQMPVMDGYEASRRIRAMADPVKAAVPIVGVSANAFEEDLNKAFAAGMDGYVAKPVDPQKLLETLATTLDNADNKVLEDPGDVSGSPRERT